jgi:hypothetical protein
MRTTLYEKMFIDGFQKPSYVVATLTLDRALSDDVLDDAIVRTLEQHPRLRSRARTMLGVPVALDPQSSSTWRERGGIHRIDSADLHALEERLLGSPLDLRRSLPIEVHVVTRPAALVVKVHHAVIDAASGFGVLQAFARNLGGVEPRPRTRARTRSPKRRSGLLHVLDWAARIQLRPRLPGPGVSARYRPSAELEREPVTYVERMLPAAHGRLVDRARSLGATFFELVASAFLSGMARYNAVHHSARAPQAVGLMFARARSRGSSTVAQAAFRADTGTVSVPATRLVTPHHRETLAELRRASSDRRHNDLALAALYAARKMRRPSHLPAEQDAISFTLSDLTALGKPMRATSALPISGVRVLASPTSFDHAGLLVSRFGDDVRLSLVAHRGAVDADALLGATLACLLEEG